MLLSLNHRRFLILIFGIAIVLRLVLMPFFAHVDLYSEMRRVFYVIENGYYLENAHRFLVFYIEIIGAAVSMFFIDVTQGLFHLDDPKNSAASLVDYGFFLNDPNLYRHLFFFKLPYLVFDLATAAIIWKFIDDPYYKRLGVLLWLFNPLTIFSTYIFGRFEVISLFFLALTALKLKQHQIILAAMSFGAALLCREINLLFAPFFLLAVLDYKDAYLKQVLSVAACAFIVVFMYMLPEPLLSALGGDTSHFVPLTGAHEVDALNKLLSMGYYWFYPIIICLAVLGVYAWEVRSADHAQRYVICCAVALFIYFGFNVHSVHYAAWLVIMPILSLQYGREVLLPMFALVMVWLILWLLKTDAGVFTLFLAAPLNPDLAQMGHFPSYYQRHFASSGLSLYQAIQIVRSLFLVVMLFFAYRLLRSRLVG
ncbi:MAG: hypothetical protein AAF197_04350 [Pseudomonadota bacterium]